MNRSLLWRGLLIVAVVTVAAVAAYPLREEIKLGLDLQGGMHLVLQVEVEDALRAETEKDIERLLEELREAGLSGVAGRLLSTTTFEVTGAPADRRETVEQVAEDFLPGWSWEPERDRLVFTMTAQNENQIRDLAVIQALETIRNRVDAFGVSEPVIQRQGLANDRIVVQLPGVDDPERVKKLIKNTAFLEFRLVDHPGSGQPLPTSREEVLAHYGGQLPPGIEVMPGELRDESGQVIGRQFYAVEARRVITGRDLKDARPGLGQFNQPVVNFTLTHEGGEAFAKATGDNVGRGLAIILDGKVVSAPRINDRIRDSGVIEGRFSQREVQDLSTVLRSGALPAGITYLEERTVGPSLGQDSIRQGRRAGYLGAALVVLSMLAVYKVTGVNAILALAINVVLVFGALAYFGATLTLPGIAGIVLTVGMSVDANVLIFERIREELRAGKTVRSAIDVGFSKALSSILDANVTTLIAALFLFQFGTGPVRGFAVTLSVGILASLFTAVVVSRWFFDLVLTVRRADRLSI